MIAGRLVVTGGAGRPYALDAVTLRTEGVESFDGRLPDRELLLIGTPHFDPSRNRLCYLEMDPATHAVVLWEVDPSGRAERTMRVSLPRFFLLHDFALTPRKLIVPGGGVFLSYERLPSYLLGAAPMGHCFPFRPEVGIEFHVFNRRSINEVRVYQVRTPGYPVHVANAYDEGDTVVLDISIHSTDAAVRGYTTSLAGGEAYEAFRSSLHRVRLFADGGSRMEPLVPGLNVEAPTVDPRREGRPHRYIYAMETQRGVIGGSRVVRVDTERRETRTFDFGPGCIVSEPLFIPRRPADGKEEEGWVSVLVYDSARDAHFLSLLDAESFDDEAARLDVSQRLPYLYHGTFAQA